MLNGRYFKEVEALEDLKRQYRTLAMKNHPDRGGDVEVILSQLAADNKVFSQRKRAVTSPPCLANVSATFPAAPSVYHISSYIVPPRSVPCIRLN